MGSQIVLDGLEPVAEAFEAITGDGTPAALVLRREGRVVLDLESGSDGAGTPFTSETPVLLYSVVKPATALVALLAVADGDLSLDATVARFWPAFGAHGKDRVTVREALAHGAAVPGWPTPVSLDGLSDRVAAADALAASEPWWSPGEPGEHAVSYGHLVDGILRHATGRDLVARWRELQRSTGGTVSLTPQAGRAPAWLEDPDEAWRTSWMAAPGLMGELLRNPPELLDAAVMNGTAGHQAIVPAVTGYASARELARLWEWWVGAAGADRLGRGLRDESLSAQSTGRDHVLEQQVTWGLGPQLDPDFWGMGGAGGCVAGHDPGRGLSLAFTTPRLGSLDRVDPLDEALARLP